MSISKCYCGARWRINYPYGRKEKGRSVMLVEHDKKCEYIRDRKRNRRRR